MIYIVILEYIRYNNTAVHMDDVFQGQIDFSGERKGCGRHLSLFLAA